MRIVPLYKYERESGGTTVSPIRPNCEFVEMLRLVADEGKMLTNNGEDFSSCVDADTIIGWYEVDEQNISI